MYKRALYIGMNCRERIRELLEEKITNKGEVMLEQRTMCYCKGFFLMFPWDYF